MNLRYEPGPPRQYFLDDERVPGVTDIINHFFPATWSKTFFRDLGSDAHDAIELYEHDDLDEDALDEYVAPLFASYRLWREANPDWFLFGTEEMVAHPTHRYAGRIDLIFRYRARLAVVDVKSGAPLKQHRLQTAAYRAALREWSPLLMSSDLVDRFGLYLRTEGPAVLRPHHDHELDFKAFAQLRDVYQWFERTKA